MRHHRARSFPPRLGVIRCRFIFSGKNGELTPDFPSFRARMANRHLISPDSPTPEFSGGKNGHH